VGSIHSVAAPFLVLNGAFTCWGGASIYPTPPNARVVAQVQIVLNAVFVQVDASVLPVLAQDSGVVRIAPVGNYEKDLFETVPYIGASAVQDNGYDGSGIKVAVLDSGIDYTHAALGGSGDPADYASNDPDAHRTGNLPDRESCRWL
jgi:subtilisin family serine protease